MRILVLGHRGFLGRHFWQALDMPDNLLVGVDIRPGLGDPGKFPNVMLDGLHRQYTMDVRQYFETRSLGSFDLVIHAAAIVGGRKTIDGSPLAIATNLALDTALFQWAAKARPGKIVYMSSSAVYPIDYQSDDCYERIQLEENDADPTDPTGKNFGMPDAMYGFAKLSGEKLAGYAAADGLDVLIPRPFSGYSHLQSRDYPFPSFIDRARRRADPFEIWGDGQQVRDWVHVDDVVGCVLAAVDQGVTGPLNIGTGRPTRFVELADMITKAAGYSPEFEFHLDAPRGVAYRVADVTRMNEVYTAKISLEEGIERALAYGRDK